LTYYLDNSVARSADSEYVRNLDVYGTLAPNTRHRFSNKSFM
jgi:hypothetical protein